MSSLFFIFVVLIFLLFLTVSAKVYYTVAIRKDVYIIMKIKAHAKINLMLDVKSKRPDGYHNVDMIMQTVGICDFITIEKTLSGIELKGTGKLPYDKTNLVYKAAKLFFDATGIRYGVRIYVEKNIPMCAGMAGGSADAAAVLTGLNTLFGKPIPRKRLAKMSKVLGADVPFCIYGGTMRATGIGDVLERLAPMPRKCIVVAKPPVSVSTPEAYAGLDLENMPHPDTESAVNAIEKGDTKTLYSIMGNSFEYSIFKKLPEIAKIKQKLLSMGADASLMSGSGSAVFGIFEDENLAKNAYEDLKKKYKDVFITHTVSE